MFHFEVITELFVYYYFLPADLDQLEKLGIPLSPFRFDLQDASLYISSVMRHSLSASEHNKLLSRLHSSSVDWIKIFIEQRMVALQATINHLDHHRMVLEKEEKALSTFSTQRPKYEESLVVFTKSLVDQRRQKSLQLSIELRKRRLEELRATRLRAMAEAKEKQEFDAKNAIEAVQRKKKEREEKSLSKVFVVVMVF